MKYGLAGVLVGVVFAWALTGCVEDDATYSGSSVTGASDQESGDQANGGAAAGGGTSTVDDGRVVDEPDMYNSNATSGGLGVTSAPGGGAVIASGGVELGVTCAVDGLDGPPLGDGLTVCGASEPDACRDNAPPVLGTPQFLVDGAVRGQLDALPADGKINLLIPYEDANCNLACGMSDELLLGANFEGRVTRELSSELPCRSRSDLPGSCLSATLYVDPHVSGEHTFTLEVADACGASSAPLGITVRN